MITNVEIAQRHKNKYYNRNPIQRYVLSRFFTQIYRKIAYDKPTSILDFGCGEGLFAQRLLDSGLPLPNYLGIDIRQDAIREASLNNPQLSFICEDIFAERFSLRSFDLVIASQVLEHLDKPEYFVERIVALSARSLLITVPYEPWFQMMNLLRGRDITRFGNHPEHLHHWNPSSLQKLLARYTTEQQIKTSFPFIIAFCRI